MKIIPVTADRWFFATANEVRWLAIQALIMSVESGQDFKQLYLGALADKVLDWQIKNRTCQVTEQVALAHTLTINWHEYRDNYVPLKKDWQNIISESVVPVGQLVAHMLEGKSQQAAIGEYVKLCFRIENEWKKKGEPKSSVVRDIKKLSRAITSKSDRVRNRLIKYKHILPYVYFEFQRVEALTWQHYTNDSGFSVLDPSQFNSFAAEAWKVLLTKDRVRFRRGPKPILLNFRYVQYDHNLPIDRSSSRP